MWINLILIIVIILFVFKLQSLNRNEQPSKKIRRVITPNINYPQSDNLHVIESNKLSKLSTKDYTHDYVNTQKYQNDFFGFQNRLYCNSHLGDPVDYINIEGLTGCDNLNKPISEIYDDLVGSNEYKDKPQPMRQLNQLVDEYHEVIQ